MLSPRAEGPTLDSSPISAHPRPTSVHLCPELSHQTQRGGCHSLHVPKPAVLTAAPCLFTCQPAP